jgi:hypothetical protein
MMEKYGNLENVRSNLEERESIVNWVKEKSN